MADIIHFPQSKSKVIKQINDAERNADFEKMYHLFNVYEQHFDLNEDIALKKCRMLLKLNAYLELREEAIILLKRGFNCYDELMIYYIKSLNGLGQFYEAVEVINQIIDEVKNHKTRMELFPLKEYAISRLDEDREALSSSLSDFGSLNTREQTSLILQLIDNGHYNFKESVANILISIELPKNLVSLMLEYLRFAEYSHTITIHKYGETINVNPNHLSGIEHTTIKDKVIPVVMNRLEDGALHILKEAQHMMNNHSILMYPIDIESLYTIDDWIDAYDVYFKQLIGIDINGCNNDTLQFIKSLDNEM
ncbi:hypothetical protein [Staphylococcus epidermidis]|uniref:hypothetical protein n=1 Tax=Staphylococcus epidermidis TaxID=1282 RepID=UPI0002433661|nr:hypothetical protein [Staphylococcus epidermidis]APT16136.1 hypothetical protein BUM85_04205 [Staphylococcus epidermidis]EHM73290.1 hypothetical protein HMPREF9956_1358 [Staphylococcus epidermidis 14.1.R1.SE]